VAAPRWEELQRQWAEDPGALVDIRVPNATVDDWRRVIDLVEARWSCALEVDGDPAPFPPDLAILAPVTDTTRFSLLRVGLTPLINLNAHLPDSDIEFDFDPREVLDQSDLDAIVDFVATLGRALGQVVHVVVEGGDIGGMDCLRYEPDSDQVVLP